MTPGSGQILPGQPRHCERAQGAGHGQRVGGSGNSRGQVDDFGEILITALTHSIVNLTSLFI